MRAANSLSNSENFIIAPHRDLPVLLDQAQGFAQGTHESIHHLGFRFDELVVGGHRLEAHLQSMRVVWEKFLDTSGALIYFFFAKYRNWLAAEPRYSNHATL
jgi:hypothetical protein